MSVVWEEPPALRRRGGRVTRFAETIPQLIERSGQWARIDEGLSRGAAASYASRARRSLGPWANHVWEARYAQQPDKTCHLYVRHLAKKDS